MMAAFTTISFAAAPLANDCTTTGSGGSTCIPITLDNPLKSATILDIVNMVLDAAIKILGTLVVIMIIYSGFLFVTAQGAPEKIGSAKKTLMYACIGAALIIAAKLIGAAVESVIASLAS